MGVELQSSEEKASAQLLHRRKPLRLYFKKMLRVSVPRKPSPCPEWHSLGLLNSWVLAGRSSSSAQSYTPMCIVSASASQLFLLYCFYAFLTSLKSATSHPGHSVYLHCLSYFSRYNYFCCC